MTDRYKKNKENEKNKENDEYTPKPKVTDNYFTKKREMN